MKRKMVLTVLAFLLVLQTQTVFAADYNADFLKAAGKNDLGAMEQILQRRANQMNLSSCMNEILRDRVSGFNRGNTINVLRLLIRYGADANSGLSASIQNQNQPIEIIKFLLDSGAKLTRTNLDDAVVRGSFDVFKFLLQYGGDIDINERTYSATNKTMLMVYSTRKIGQINNFDLVKLLVENGAKVNLRDDNGATAASLAYDNGEIEIYNYLKSKGAIDFEPKQVTQQPAAPAQSTTNVYVQPSAPAQSTPTQPAPAPRPAAPTLRPGRYAYSGSNVTMDIASPLTMVTLYSGYTAVAIGNYTINGNTLVISILRASSDDYKFMVGRTYDYTITSDSSFSGQGERWVRTGN